MTMRRTRSTPRVVFGLLLIAVGLYTTLDNFGLAPNLNHFFEYWPLFFVLVGALKLRTGNVGPGLFFLTIGGFLLWPVFQPEVDRWELIRTNWPVLLVCFGVVLVLRSFGGERRKIRGEDIPYINSFGILSTERRLLTSSKFRGGDLAAFMGGCEIDLTQAQLAAEGAAISIFAFWGGITIKVPPQWIVDLEAVTIMGGSEDKARQDSTPSGPRLTVKGLVVMGGVEVSS